MRRFTRREFVRRTGLGVGSIASAGGLGPLLAGCRAADDDGVGPGASQPEVIVIGAGAFGGWTALHLQRMGAHVTLVDRYGPGNPRSTSGGETRGVRSAYGDRELWTAWANLAMARWRAFDEERAERSGGEPLFYSAGDLILRPSWDPFLESTRQTFDKLGVAYDILEPGDVAERWPWIRPHGLRAALFERGAGVVRARAACEAVADALVREGGELVLADAQPGDADGDRLRDVRLEPGGRQAAESFVFALGPWLAAGLPGVEPGRVAIPMGHVYYFDTPSGDDRFLHPAMPTYGVPSVTGWPSLPSEPQGFRVRVGGRSGGDGPDATSRDVPERYHDEPREILAQHFPDLADAPLADARACHYETTGNGEWIVDRHPQWSNAWIAGGGNAEGFKFGPVIGEYVAARVLGNDPNPELAGRFTL